jgi:ABC-type transporter Mla subunit MlaD
VANQFAASTSNILAILSNQSVTGETIDKQATAVRQAIGGGASAVKQASELLTAIQQPYNILAADSAPFLQDISQNPQEISQLLQGLNTWANAWITAEASGPYLNLTTNVVVANPADLGLAVLGGSEVANYLSAGLGPGFVNPATYSGAASIPSGTSAATEASAISQDIASNPTPVMDEGTQAQALSQIVTAIAGKKPVSVAISTLLLSPVLEGLVSAG